MEINGDDFLKNVQIKQEEDTLKQKLNEFENFRQQNNIQNNPPKELQNNPYKEYVSPTPQNDNELGEILLQNLGKTDSKENKKKYILLSIALVLLFVITIIIIRLITDDSNGNNINFQEQSTLEQDKALNDEKIQQEYQQLLTDKLKKVNKDTVLEIPKETNDELKNLEEQEELLPQEEVQQQKEVQQTNPLNIIKEKPAPVKKVTPVKPVVKKPTTIKKTSSIATKGIYIQIGAFSKTPSNNYLSNITSKGYKFKLHTMTIQGKKLIKVLIGPYTNRTQAQNNLTTIRTTFSVAGAYILKI